MKRALFGLIAVVIVSTAPHTKALGGGQCVPTGWNGLTAVLVNPGNVNGATVAATNCDMGIYYDSTGTGGTVINAEIYGALYYGVFVNGDAGAVSVDVLNSSIHNIGDSPLNGNQRGVGIYYRAYMLGGSASGKVSGNQLRDYQKGGLVFNGQGTNVIAQNNIVEGQGPVAYIAQNGIQFGYGSSGSAMKNTVTGHSYMGTSTVSGGIIVVGGAGYGSCPDGNPCAYTNGVQIVQNKVVNNDIGVWLTNIDAASNPPADATNIKVVNNTISNKGLDNNYYGVGYQAGIADQGNNDKLISNTISGAGYDPLIFPLAWVMKIDADTSFTNRPKVHANK